MFVFYFKDKRLYSKRHIQCFIRVFEYINKLIIYPKSLYISFYIEHDKIYREFDAFTEIIESQCNFPIKSNIFILKHSLKYNSKYFTYMILHEVFHALGLMCSIYTKWRDLISNDKYIGKYASSLYKRLYNRELYIHNCKDDTEASNLNHLSGYFDFFSEQIYETISPITIMVLKDYGYKINEKIDFNSLLT